MAHSSRSKELIAGVRSLSRSQVYKKRALYKRAKTPTVAKKSTTKTVKVVPVNGAKNGKQRVVPLRKAPRWYSADEVKQPLQNRKKAGKATLRKSITPGTVLILLAGRFRGKRVVFLKQLESGLLLVTGPYKVNGIPLRRVNQSYVIATSTKVNISTLKIDEHLNDAYFRAPSSANAKKSEGEFFNEKAAEKTISETRVKDQKAVDNQLLSIIKKTPLLGAYLRSTFSLSSGSLPHLMKF